MQMSMNMCIYVYNIYVYSCDIHILICMFKNIHMFIVYFMHMFIAHVFLHMTYVYVCTAVASYLPVYRSISAVTPVLDD